MGGWVAGLAGNIATSAQLKPKSGLSLAIANEDLNVSKRKKNQSRKSFVEGCRPSFFPIYLNPTKCIHSNWVSSCFSMLGSCVMIFFLFKQVFSHRFVYLSLDWQRQFDPNVPYNMTRSSVILITLFVVVPQAHIKCIGTLYVISHRWNLRIDNDRSTQSW